MRSTLLRLVVIVAAVSLWPPSLALAQDTTGEPPAASLETAIVRVAGSPAAHRGLLVDLTSRSVTLLVDDGRVEFELNEVDRIALVRDRIWDGALVGAIVGAIQATVIVRQIKDDRFRAGRGPGRGTMTAIAVQTTGFCFLVGAGIDALHRGTTTIYSRASGWSNAGAAIRPAVGFRFSF